MEEIEIDDYVLSLDIQFKRYPMLFQHVQTIINKNGCLTEKEQQLYLLGAEKFIAKTVNNIKLFKELADNKKGNYVIALKDKNIMLKRELFDFYNDFSKKITDTLLPISKTADSTISCRRSLGYVTTLLYPHFSIDEKTTVRNRTLESFNQAMYMAKTSLKFTDDLKLELVLNFANFEHICYGYTQEAIQIMQEAIGMAMENGGNELTPKGRRMIEAMINNITMWCHPDTS
ncbi:hypothetical protein TVAG_314940 [Trichomonas vaginalis G3]|uniref:14-3-3 domain-containing protein n=1 Tax=Trichomonas vaginalis (strain ATCC PRA-98 / G3) TaxID=412133 RepID=A2ETT3_TRIV3|nr:14-3-3 protein family [Trichomonas vaginalis G3]EAY03964.1 hypothetical protein TVAG_314940 [Trichomonas vaginalis G3]KAI5541018.1 14-3-3 protein family [Trichomonas vaginalis G3]|eukprot:XP_001316187.1 hypothetical protein [Trichomonas vaginalis G3]